MPLFANPVRTKPANSPCLFGTMKSFLLLLGVLATASAASWSKGGVPEGGAIVSVAVTAVKGDGPDCILAGAPSSGGGPSGGPHAYVSTDYSANFTASTKLGFDLMAMSVAASGSAQNIAVGGVVGVHHSADGGKTWALAAGGPGVSQSLVGFGDGNFGCAFASSGTSGAAVSTDGGKSFAKHAITALDATSYPARYAAFPSDTTWYVSHGTWGGSSAAAPGVSVELSDTVKVALNGKATVAAAQAPGGDGNGYFAAISKTTDGGKTFAVQYTSAGKFYFNDIHCASTEHCIAVAEGHNVPQPGAHIFVTSDGGVTWTNTFSIAGGASLMGVRDLDGKEGWAVGGAGFTALFLHTTDGGKTWKNEPVAGLHCLGVDFASASNGYAVCINQMRQTQVAVFK